MRAVLELFLLASGVPICSAAGLVNNGTFDSGSCAGWTATPTPFNTSGYNECRASGGNSGGFAVLNDNPNVLVTMTQAIAGLTVGATYRLTWDMEDVYNCCASSTTPGAGASIDGSIWEFIVQNGQPWQHHSETFTYKGTSNVLTFSAQRNGTDTDAGFDNIALSPVDLSSDLANDCHVALYGVLFDLDRSTLQAASDPMLQQVLDLLKKTPTLKLEIQGHTDNLGNNAYNQTLSEARALAVLTWLNQHGIAADRLTAKGYGETVPIADNGSDQGRAKNRRVEIADPRCTSKGK